MAGNATRGDKAPVQKVGGRFPQFSQQEEETNWKWESEKLEKADQEVWAGATR